VAAGFAVSKKAQREDAMIVVYLPGLDKKRGL
jgi:hypothetical protein